MALDREGKPVKCTSPQRAYTSQCLKCEQRIVIHCSDCGVQISGCMCTLSQRMKKEG